MSTHDPVHKTDPVTLALMQHALASAADQMALSLYPTAYSTIVRDCLDFSTSLCDAEGQMSPRASRSLITSPRSPLPCAPS